MALTIKQEKFCIEYAKSGNARQAYKKAGYKCKNDASVDASASQLLRNPKVKERLAELTEEVKNNAIADIQEMQETLTKIIRQNIEEEVIMFDPASGIQREKKTPAVKEIISAINTLGKMQGAFIEKLDVTGSMPVVISGEGELHD